MNKTEAKMLLMKYLIPGISKYGFKERGRGTEFQIVRKTGYGEDVINGVFTDYNPRQQIIFNCYKRDKRIISILELLEARGIKLSPPISKHSGTIGFSYESLNNHPVIGYLPIMAKESDVEQCAGRMVDLIESYALPLFDKFEDLREIDSIINGETPWQTDWRMPYVFGGYFNLIRLIVAKLSGNSGYLDLIEFTYASLQRRAQESGHTFTYDRNDLSKPLPALISL